VENLAIPALAACALSLVLSSGSILWCLAFSSPASLRKEVDGVRAQVSSAIAEVQKIESQFLAQKNDLAAFEESVTGILESVERKRKQIAGSASRLQMVEPEQPVTRDDIVAAARAKVYG